MYPTKLNKNLETYFSYEDVFDTEKPLSYTKSYFHETDIWTIGMHEHSFYEINITIAGEGRHYIENTSFDTKIGAVYILPPNIEHGYYTNSSLTLFHLLISPPFFEKYQEELSYMKGYQLLFAIEPHLRSKIDEQLFLVLSTEQLKALMPYLNDLVGTFNSSYIGAAIVGNAKSLALIGKLSELISQSNINTSANNERYYASYIIRTMEYINVNFAEKLTIETLCKIAGMSRSIYLREFQRINHCTPTDYISKYRVAQAKLLLLKSDASISEIAQTCGFFDNSHFSRTFYKYEKVLPSKLRHDIKKETI